MQIYIIIYIYSHVVKKCQKQWNWFQLEYRVKSLSHIKAICSSEGGTNGHANLSSWDIITCHNKVIWMHLFSTDRCLSHFKHTHTHTIQSPPFCSPHASVLFCFLFWNELKRSQDSARLEASRVFWDFQLSTQNNNERRTCKSKALAKGGTVTCISWISWYTLGFGFPPLLVTLTMRRLSFSLSDTKISRYISYWTSIWSLPLRFKWIVNPEKRWASSRPASDFFVGAHNSTYKGFLTPVAQLQGHF